MRNMLTHFRIATHITSQNAERLYVMHRLTAVRDSYPRDFFFESVLSK